MKPVVSVIIPAYNCARFLPESLESVLRQTFRDFEVIIVDDGSTDNTPAVLESYFKAYPDLIRYIRKQNGGPASARNAGIQEARGELIAFQDADDIWMPEKLEMQVAYLREHPEAGVVFTDYALLSGETVLMPSIQSRYEVPSGMIFEKLLTQHFIAMPSVMVRRACLDQVGVFDETLIGAEDYNFYLRLASRYPFGFVDKLLVKVRSHEDSLSENLEQMCRDEVANLEKIAAAFPERGIPRRKLAARIYIRFGKYHFSRKEHVAARKCFWSAIRCHPNAIEAGVFLMLLCLPASLRDALFLMKRKVMKKAHPA